MFGCLAVFYFFMMFRIESRPGRGMQAPPLSFTLSFKRRKDRHRDIDGRGKEKKGDSESD